ncbi:MAG: OmpA family protein, partial [Acinetobacter sp.]
MNINLIDLLKQKVSAVVLEGETEHLSEKSQALTSFFPILLSILKSKPDLIANLQSQLNPRLSDIFTKSPALKHEFLEQISGVVPTETIEATLNRSIAPTLGVLEAEAGSAEPSAITHLIETHWPAISSTLPHWAGALLSALGIGTASAAGNTLHQAPKTEPYRAVEEKKKSGFLLPLIAFLILAALLALMFKACSAKKEPVSTSVSTQVASEPANMTTAVDTSAAITSGNSNAEKALAEINPDNIRALDVATALNMQIINFDTASANIPDVNKTILDQAAGLMKRASHVKLTVKGFTDAVGDAAANKALSQKRAQAVVDYLVKQGVDPAQLQAVGYGQEQPVADNSTTDGQFKNRRIEFEVLNTETG